jgi:carboxypeptidase Taq
MSTNIKKAYEEFLGRCKDAYVLQSAMGVISWDMQTKMPPAGVRLRGQQASLLQVIFHKMVTDPEWGNRVESIMSDPDYAKLGAVEKRNLFLAKKVYDENAKIPESLVADLARQRTVAIDVWKKAKAAKNYGMFKPELEKMIELRKKLSEILMKVKGTKTPYDALLDGYEPGLSAEDITRIFNDLGVGLVDIMNKVKKTGFVPDASIMTRPVPVEIQHRISEAAMEFIGYETKGTNAWGRLDETEHPFTTGYYDDVRITTRFTENWWPRSLFTVLHEGGHAVYDRNYPREYMYQPVGDRCSHGIHESQSRFIENIVGKSPEFLSYMLPRLKKIAGKPFRGVKVKDFVAAVNRVAPTVLRGQADEATYNLHIIIRFEMERDIFAGKLSVEDLPAVWNRKYREYLGVEVKDDSEGVMQDTHWASGSYGYFPSYAIGNIYDGMFLKKMNRDVPGWRKRLKRGEFKPVGDWLALNVQQKGNFYDPPDLIKEVTGEKLTVKPFLSYLDKKYSKIYGY